MRTRAMKVAWRTCGVSAGVRNEVRAGDVVGGEDVDVWAEGAMAGWDEASRATGGEVDLPFLTDPPSTATYPGTTLVRCHHANDKIAASGGAAMTKFGNCCSVQ